MRFQFRREHYTPSGRRLSKVRMGCSGGTQLLNFLVLQDYTRLKELVALSAKASKE